MTTININILDENAYEQLRLRAAKHGVSIEEEARRIIYLAVAAPIKISAIFQTYFGDKNGVTLTLPN